MTSSFLKYSITRFYKSMNLRALFSKGIKMLSCAAIILSCVSCSKQGVKQFQGYYSYKTSGSITLTATTDASEGSLSGPDILTWELESETGQLNIVTRSAKEGTMLLTTSPINGGVRTYEMHLKDSRLVSEKQAIALKFKGLTSGTEHNLEVSLDAEKVGDIVLILHNVSGTASYMGRDYTVSSSEIKTVGKEN